MKNGCMGISCKYGGNIGFFWDIRCVFGEKKCVVGMLKVWDW